MVILKDSESELKEKIEDFKNVLQTIKIVKKVSDSEFVVLNEATKREHKVTVYKMDINGLTVYDAECDCEDFRFRGTSKGKPCKHILAVLRDMFAETQQIREEIKAGSETKPMDKSAIVSKPAESFEPIRQISQTVSEKVSEKIVPSAEAKEQVLALVPSELQKREDIEEEKIVKMVDELDEKIIMREYFVGQAPLVYRILPKKEGGQINYILSIRGWIEAALLHKNIVIENVEFLKVENKLIAIAWVRDVARNVRTFGVAERATNEEFKLTMLASKAMRNALKAIVAPEYEKRVIEMAQNAKAIIDLRHVDLRGVGVGEVR